MRTGRAASAICSFHFLPGPIQHNSARFAQSNGWHHACVCVDRTTNKSSTGTPLFGFDGVTNYISFLNGAANASSVALNLPSWEVKKWSREKATVSKENGFGGKEEVTWHAPPTASSARHGIWDGNACCASNVVQLDCMCHMKNSWHAKTFLQTEPDTGQINTATSGVPHNVFTLNGILTPAQTSSVFSIWKWSCVRRLG